MLYLVRKSTKEPDMEQTHFSRDAKPLVHPELRAEA